RVADRHQPVVREDEANRARRRLVLGNPGQHAHRHVERAALLVEPARRLDLGEILRRRHFQPDRLFDELFLVPRRLLEVDPGGAGRDRPALGVNDLPVAIRPKSAQHGGKSRQTAPYCKQVFCRSPPAAGRCLIARPATMGEAGYAGQYKGSSIMPRFRLATIAFGALVAAPSVVAARTPLQTEVFTAGDSGYAVTSTIIYGPKDAILVDAQFTHADANRLAD